VFTVKISFPNDNLVIYFFMYSKNILFPLKAKNKLALSHLFTQNNDIGSPKDSKTLTLQKGVLIVFIYFFTVK